MRDDIIALLSDLVAIDSVNPALVQGGAGEAAIARAVADWARSAGLEAELLEATPGRPSVLARARGSGGGRTLLLCGHTDTVNVEGMTDPHVARVDGDRLHGRGAWAEIEVTGKAAHGSRPHLGVDAIVKSWPVLEALGQLDVALGAHAHPLLGRGSVHASTITGGAELSSYPARCVLGLERRTLPGESQVDIEAELDALLDRCRAADPELIAERRTLLVREPFEVERSEAIVEAVGAAAATVTGAARPVSGASYWADAAFIAAAGIPTVMFGPSGEGAHALEEWVSIADTEAVARTLVATAARLCA